MRDTHKKIVKTEENAGENVGKFKYFSSNLQLSLMKQKKGEPEVGKKNLN